MPQPQQVMKITHWLREHERPEELTMLAEALMAWDHMEPKGMHDDRFMLAYLAERRDPDDPREYSLSLSAVSRLIPEVQEAPITLLHEIAKLPPERLRRFGAADEEPEHRTVGLAFFIHSWGLTGNAMADMIAGRYTGTASEHPDRERIRLMAAHYNGHTLTLARTEGQETPRPMPPEQYGRLIPALEAASAAIAAATKGEPA